MTPSTFSTHFSGLFAILIHTSEKNRQFMLRAFNTLHGFQEGLSKLLLFQWVISYQTNYWKNDIKILFFLLFSIFLMFYIVFDQFIFMNLELPLFYLFSWWLFIRHLKISTTTKKSYFHQNRSNFSPLSSEKNKEIVYFFNFNLFFEERRGDEEFLRKN